jgi:hypothetical protein
VRGANPQSGIVFDLAIFPVSRMKRSDNRLSMFQSGDEQQDYLDSNQNAKRSAEPKVYLEILKN